MRKLLVPAVIALALATAPSGASGEGKLSVRAFGGYGYHAAGDVNRGTQSFFDWGSSYLAPPPGGSIQGGYAPRHGGYELGGDIILELSPKLGLGLGAGFLESEHSYRPEPPMMTITDNPQGQGWIKYFNTATKLSAIPVRLGVFLSLPVGGKASFIANAGISGYLKARYEGIWNVNFVYSGKMGYWPAQTFSTEAQKNGLGLGFHGGLGIDYAFFPSWSFFVEAQGRVARFAGFEGQTDCVAVEAEVFPPFYETGKLYYENAPQVPGSPRLIMVQSAPPAGPSGQPREAVVDLSGFSLRAGFRFHF